MGWGIIGGAAVNAYNNQRKTDQELALQQMQMAEQQRQIAMATAADNAANGTGGSTPTQPQDPTQAQPQDGDSPSPIQATPQPSSPDAPPIDSSLDGSPSYTPTVQAPTAPKGTGLPVAPTAAPQAPLKPSQIMMQRAQAMMNSGGGVKAMQTASQMYTTGVQMAQQEHEQELNGILSSKQPFEQKVDQLAGLITGSDNLPGSATVQKGDDGAYHLIHTVPGKDQPFDMKLEGSTPQEVLQNLAMNVRGMHDSGLAMKMQEFGETKRHNIKTEDYHDERNAWQAEAAAQKNAAFAQIADAKMQAALAAGDSAQARAEAARIRGSMGNLVPYGTAANGDALFLNTNASDPTKAVVQVPMPQGATPFNKVTGAKAGGQPRVLDDREKIAYTNALQELPPKATPADKLAVASKYNLDPNLFGVSALPSPAALGAPKPAAPAGRGLQMQSSPQLDSLKMNLDNARNMMMLSKPGTIQYQNWQSTVNRLSQQISAMQPK